MLKALLCVLALIFVGLESGSARGFQGPKPRGGTKARGPKEPQPESKRKTRKEKKEKEKEIEQSKKLKCIDMAYLMHCTKSNPKLMMEMISLYLAQTPPLVSAMKQSLQDRDWDSLHAAVHASSTKPGQR